MRMLWSPANTTTSYIRVGARDGNSLATAAGWDINLVAASHDSDRLASFCRARVELRRRSRLEAV